MADDDSNMEPTQPIAQPDMTNNYPQIVSINSVFVADEIARLRALAAANGPDLTLALTELGDMHTALTNSSSSLTALIALVATAISDLTPLG
jgi:hypothetical protein